MFVVLCLMVLSLPLTIAVLQRQQPPQSPQPFQPTQPYATATSGTYVGAYAANIEYDANEGYGTYNARNLASPTINAIDINMNWSVVEPQEGVFNWAPADNAIAAWAGKGKKFVLVLRYIHEVSANSFHGCNDDQQYLPTWEIARIPTYCDFDKNTVIPDYFDPGFKAGCCQSHWQQSLPQQLSLCARWDGSRWRRVLPLWHWPGLWYRKQL